MKKVVAIALMLLLLTGCNYSGYDFIDTNYSFQYAQIVLPDGTVKTGEVEKWADADGEQLTITFTDGSQYMVSSINAVLYN